jgi:hypothetical protein
MKTISPNTPYGYTVFCDDLRVENTGKFIYIGVYPAEMMIWGPMPAQLPTLAFSITYHERRGESSDPVVFKIFMPNQEQPVITAELDVETLRSIPLGDTSVNEDELLVSFTPVKLGQIQIESEGLIKVRAYRGDDEIRLGTLRVRTAAQATPSS